MKQRSTYILLGVFVVLAVITFFLVRPPGEREASYSLAHLDLTMDSAKVQNIAITRASGMLSLKNIGGIWYVTKGEEGRRYPADENSVNRLLGSIQKLKITSLISSKPERQGLFQVDSTGTLLSCTDRDGKVLSFYVGKMGPSFSESYIRPANSDDVLLAEGITTWDVAKELKDWRDKVIQKIVRDSVHELTFRYAKERFTLLRDTQPDTSGSPEADGRVHVWRMQPAPKEKINEPTITALLGSLENLRADDFVDSVIRLPSPQLTLDLKTPEPVTMSFTPVPPDSSKYWVKTSATEQLFTASKWNVQPILKQKKDFFLQ